MRLFSDYHLHPQGIAFNLIAKCQPWADHARKSDCGISPSRIMTVTGADFDEIERLRGESRPENSRRDRAG
jgi:hypothetical protein